MLDYMEERVKNKLGLLTNIAQNEEGEPYLRSNDQYINWGRYLWGQTKQRRTIDQRNHTELRKKSWPESNSLVNRETVYS